MPANTFDMLRRPAIALTALALLAWPSSSTALDAVTAKNHGLSGWSLRWQPQRLVNGSPVVFQVTSPARLTSVAGKWLDHDVFFSYDARSRNWFGIAGISLETPPGKHELMLEGEVTLGRSSRGTEPSSWVRRPIAALW